MISCPVPALCAIFRRIVTDYRNCRSGFPDLTLWNDDEKTFAVSFISRSHKLVIATFQ